MDVAVQRGIGMYCQQCGTNAGQARFCPNCGRAMPTASPYQASSPPPSRSQRSRATVALAGGAVGVIIVLLAGILVLMMRSDRTNGTATDSRTASSSPSDNADSGQVAKKRKGATHTSQAAASRDVRALPAGLFCHDLNARGFSYVAAVDYWRMHGQPNQMDADRNGIPCETVYPVADVTAYWGGRNVPGLTPSSGLTSGLFCRDLLARGLSYSEAVAYWWVQDMPDRMDADHNGIPCETVYSASDVNSFWYR